MDLGWLSKIMIPESTEVEVVDFGTRVVVVITRRDEELTVVGDMETGDRALKTNGADESVLIDFAMRLLAMRQRDGSSTPDTSGGRATVRAIADLTGAVFIPYGSVRWPLTHVQLADD